MDAVISVEALSKKYRLDHELQRERYVALRDVLASSSRRLVERLRGASQGVETEEFWALRDLTFNVKRGDVVGVIGRNGAGKSTLLKVLSRITEPTSGRITIAGRVSSLLEVGTGFHPELTGRENIYLNGAILGMSRVEVHRNFEEIVEFADVARFLDTPVKRYSSGMYMRLAFAVAAFLQSDILIIDEVLAVGDAAFQKKCLGRMGDVSRSGRTVLFVSHNLGSVMSICSSGILLDTGRIVLAGETAHVVQAYQLLGHQNQSALAQKAFRGVLQGVIFEQISVNGTVATGFVPVRPSDPIALAFRGVAKERIPNLRFGVAFSKDGQRTFTVHDTPETLEPGAFELSLSVPARFLRPGEYMIGLGAQRIDGNEWLWGGDLTSISVMEQWDESFHPDDAGVVSPPGTLSRRKANPAALAS